MLNWKFELISIPRGSLDGLSKEKKVLFLSLYFLIWGEAANVRFLPECLCYIFHHVCYPQMSSYPCISCFLGSLTILFCTQMVIFFSFACLQRRKKTSTCFSCNTYSITVNYHLQMAREMDEILRQQVAQRANSCISDNSASFLDRVITPLYETVAAVCHSWLLACSSDSRLSFSDQGCFKMIFFLLKHGV